MKKTILICLIGLCAANAGNAQGCKVQLKPLEGTYDGDCSSGKANGRGKAVGEDTYEGDFKKGYPDGKGTYTWKNKNWYEGEWKSGFREGQGTMHIVEEGAKDSLLVGFWKKDKYVGKYEKPYKILGQSSTISTVNITQGESKANEIVILLGNITGGTGTISATASQKTVPKIKLTAVDVSAGSYDGFFSEIPYQPSTTKFILRKITFPFTAHFRSENDYVEIAFYQEGAYTVEIKVLN